MTMRNTPEEVEEIIFQNDVIILRIDSQKFNIVGESEIEVEMRTSKQREYINEQIQDLINDKI